MSNPTQIEISTRVSGGAWSDWYTIAFPYSGLDSGAETDKQWRIKSKTVGSTSVPCVFRITGDSGSGEVVFEDWVLLPVYDGVVEFGTYDRPAGTFLVEIKEEEEPCDRGGSWANSPVDIRATIWDRDGQVFQEDFDSNGVILAFDPLPNQPMRFAFRSLSRSIIPAGSTVTFYCVKVGFAPGLGIESVLVECTGNQTYSNYVEVPESIRLTEVVGIAAVLNLATGVGDAPCLDEIPEGESEGSGGGVTWGEPEIWPEDETVPPWPPEEPPTPEEPPEVEEPIWPTEPVPPTAPTQPTPPASGCECEIYIAEAIMWAASWLADCFGLAIQTFIEWAPWFLEAFWEQAWALYEYHGEKIERHHEETLEERQKQTALMERQAESLESIASSLSDIRDFGPVEVSYELGLPGQVQVQGIGDDTDDYYEGGV